MIKKQERPTELVSPDEGDVAPPLEEVLAVVWGKVSVLHLLDVRTSCKCLRTKVIPSLPSLYHTVCYWYSNLYSSEFTFFKLNFSPIIVQANENRKKIRDLDFTGYQITFSLPVSTMAPIAGLLSISFSALEVWPQSQLKEQKIQMAPG